MHTKCTPSAQTQSSLEDVSNEEGHAGRLGGVTAPLFFGVSEPSFSDSVRTVKRAAAGPPIGSRVRADDLLRAERLGDPGAVGNHQLVDHRPDLVEVELGGGVGVEHRRVIHVLAVAGDDRLDDE